jgi:RNA polymerase sigma factor (sigma-70 family)
MGDYKLEVRIKNGKFSKMMESFGIKTVAELAKKSNVSLAALYSIANLQLDPFLRVRDSYLGTRIIEGHYKKAYTELSDFFCVSPLDLWPEDLKESLKKSVTTKYFDLKDIPQLGPIVGHKELPDPEEHADKYFQKEIIEKALSSINPKYEKVLRMRFFEDCTYDQIGDEIGVTRERVRQMIMKGLRQTKLIHNKDLKSFWEES